MRTKVIPTGSSIDLHIDEDELEKLVPVLLEDASDGNVEAVRQVLEIDARTPKFSIAFQVDCEGRNALHRASLEGRFEVLKLLLEQFKDTTEPKTGVKYIDVPDKYGNTALFLVCIRLDKSDFMQAKYLLDAGASVDVVKKSDAMTPLHWAAHHGNQQLVHELLTHHQKNPALMLCLLKDKDNRLPLDIAGLQYEKKWSEEDDRYRGDSLLSEHQIHTTTKHFTAIISQLCNPNIIPKEAGKDYWNRCLFWCAASGCRKGVEDALRRGSQPKWTHTLSSHQTSLHVAVEYGHSLPIVLFLLKELGQQKLYKMKDDQQNNPLHCFVRGTTNKSNEGNLCDRSDILRALLMHDSGNELDREKLESTRNMQGFRPVDYVHGEESSIMYTLLKTSQSNYYKQILDNEPGITFVWSFVFKIGANIHGLDTQYQKVIKKLRSNHLLADSMISAILPKQEVLVMVGATEKRLRQHAEEIEYEVQLLASREYRKYVVDEDHLFVPLNSQEEMEIIMSKIQLDVFDVDTYVEAGVIKRFFPLHNEHEREIIRELWLPNISFKMYGVPCLSCIGKNSLPPFSFCYDMSWKENELVSFQHLTALKNYFGEKVAFYFAWFSHYTIFLAGAAIPGLFVLFVQILQCISTGSVEIGLRTPFIPFFCIWMAMWTTLQNETWKRKSSELAYRWDVLDADEEETVRAEFRGDECINTTTGKIEKYHPSSVRKKKELLSLPVALTFIVAAIIAFIGARIYKAIFSKGEMAMMHSLIASVINTVAIVTLDLVYKRLARFMTDLENHCLESEYESALVTKTFWFMLVNNTAPLCWAAFYDQNMFNLFKATAITLVSKNVTNVVKDVVLPYSKHKRAQARVTHNLSDKGGVGEGAGEGEGEGEGEGAGVSLNKIVYGTCSDALLHLNPHHLSHLDEHDVKQARETVINNAVMDEYGGVVNEYAELVIQFAFVTLFACAFPGGPAVVLLINIIGMRGEIYVSLYAMQRPPTLIAGGIIKAWQNILEIIGYMAIVCNVLILVITFDMELGNVQIENITHVRSTTSLGLNFPCNNVSYLETERINISKDWWYIVTRGKPMAKLFALVILEHILLLIKMSLSRCIEDTPSWVVEAVQRQKWEQNARAEMAKNSLLTTLRAPPPRAPPPRRPPPRRPPPPPPPGGHLSLGEIDQLIQETT